MTPAYTSPSRGLHARIEKYWSHRSRQYDALRRYELESDKRELWLREILPHLPQVDPVRPLRILDVGTGTGFLAVLLALRGHTVSGVDLSPAMIDRAGRTARHLGCVVDFRVMDAARLDFGPASFDMLLSRNLTWTLPDAEAAYREWHRVLRPGGALLNFDADYGKVSFAEQAGDAPVPTLPTRIEAASSHEVVDRERLKEYDAIKETLPISAVPRPQWDMEALRRAGFVRCGYDTSLSERIYATPDPTYNPVPMFALWAEK